jgi:ABC-2 type transport system permease protein
VSYKEYFFPGALVLILLFTAIFATISIIEDRREGFLQSVLVAPLPRWSMVLGKIAGGTMIAVVQGAIFVLLGYISCFSPRPVALVAIIGWMILVALSLTALGFVLAWRMDSTQGFHAVMSVLLMPMWLLSGAFFAPKGNWLSYVIAANPLTYGVAGLRHLLYWNAGPNAEAVRDLPSFGVCAAVTIAFCIAMFAAAWKISARRTTGDLL